MRKALAVGRKELRQILRDRRTLVILLFIPVFFLLLFGYALNFDIRHVRLAVDDRDHTPESRRLVSAFVNSGYFDLGGVRRQRAGGGGPDGSEPHPRGARHPAGARRATSSAAAPAQVEVLINGDNANTAATVMGYAPRSSRPSRSDTCRRRCVRAATGPPRALEPRVWYNPQLRSTLFLVPGLLAYIAMIMAVVSTALSVVREKERGTMEQVRMAPIGTLPFIVGKSLPYFVISMVSALGVLSRRWSCSTCRCAGRGCCCSVAVAVPDRRARDGSAHFDRRRQPAGGVPGGAAVVVPADHHALGLHLPHRQHADGAAGGDLHRAGPVFLVALRAVVLKGVGIRRRLRRPSRALAIFAIAW